jgi:hypothetical protein
MSETFAVHLGGGAYLDASGKIVFGQPSDAQIYQAPPGLHVDLKKVQEAFKDLSDILPQNEEGLKKWKDWGMPNEVIRFLARVSKVAGKVATAISVYVWAIATLDEIMGGILFGDGMSPELRHALDGIKTQLKGQEQIDRFNHMIAMKAKFDSRLDRVNDLLITLSVENPIGAPRATIFQQMQTIVEELADPLSELRDQEWMITYDADAYKGRAFASPLLIFHRSDGTFPPVPMHGPHVTMFDYRLGVPMLLYGATAFTALVQIAVPWFRSVGNYATRLRRTADAIDRFVIRMQNECLARVNYTPEQVLGQQIWPIPQIPFTGTPPPTAYGTHAIAAGAFDLVGYDDAFLTQAGSLYGPRGLFTYAWVPHSDLLNEIAAAANEQSLRDYANLQTVTGMFRLISTAAWLRFLSTPPDRSQTVSGYVSDTRSLVDEQPTMARSPKILFRGVIEHPATLKRYEATSRIRITTQLPGYRPALRYRVVLRTLDCTYANGAWLSRRYVDDVWRASYEPTAADPRCNRLRTSLQSGLVVGELVLYEGHSPSAPESRSRRRATIQATTFDWYVPVASPWSQFVDPLRPHLAAQNALLGTRGNVAVATGGVSLHMMGANAILPTLGGGSKPFLPPFSYSVEDGLHFIEPLLEIPLDKAERRHVKLESVSFEWQLDWADGNLEVKVFGLSESRPFQFHLVVEETVYSGEAVSGEFVDLSDASLLERIHTPFLGEVVNQVVFVPELFFKEERDAIESAKRILDEIDRRYSESVRPGPLDPIADLYRSVGESLTLSASTATLVGIMDRRADFAIRHAPELWNTVPGSRSEPRVTGVGLISLRGNWTLRYHSGDDDESFWVSIDGGPDIKWENDETPGQVLRLDFGSREGSVRFSEERRGEDLQPIDIERISEAQFLIHLRDDDPPHEIEVTLLLERAVP